VDEFFSRHASEAKIRVIDIGCGSGILAIAALKLGAERALGVDIDPEATRAAAENADLNDVPDRIELGIGSVEEVQSGKFSLQTAQLVLANILAPVLVNLLELGLGELVETDGWLVLSGILAEQSPDVVASLAKHRYRVVSKPQMGDWVAIAALR
jgi:ribosomal protein L11 methyltransferase